MPYTPHPNRSKWEERVNAGEDAIAVAKELSIHPSTARLWLRKSKAPEATAPPTNVDGDGEPGAPLLGKAQQAEPRKRGGRQTAKVITEQTAEKLCEGMFLLAAVFTREEEWMLNEVEKKALSEPLADSLALVPAPIAAAVNAYAAPTVFASTLIGIITAKTNRIANKSRRGLTVVQPRTQPAQPQQQQAPQQQQREQPQQQQTLFNRQEEIDDVQSAVAAAKGTLREFDDGDDGEKNITAV